MIRRVSKPNVVSNDFDPYRRCPESCVHDLARGVLVDELLDRDGPYPRHPMDSPSRSGLLLPIRFHVQLPNPLVQKSPPRSSPGGVRLVDAM